jgi:hypothetical protein
MQAGSPQEGRKISAINILWFNFRGRPLLLFPELDPGSIKSIYF